MLAAGIITTLAHKETAKQAILKQLREAGATSPQMAVSPAIDGDEGRTALADLLTAGTVKESHAGRYYLDQGKVKKAKPVNGFVALLALLIALSFAASLLAMATSR